MLLRYYDDLVRGKRAPALPQGTGRWRGEFDSRLRRRGPGGAERECDPAAIHKRPGG